MLLLWAGGCLFLACTHFLSSNGVPNSWDSPIPNIDATMEGYDPVRSNPLKRPDPGIRNQIFEPTTQLADKSVVLNDFVIKARENLHCDSKVTGKSIRNYNEYKSEKSSSYAFSVDAAASVGGEYGGFSFEASAGYGREEDKEQSSIKSFFQETNGEIVIGKTQCITHEVGITSYVKPVFSTVFMAALNRLHFAAKNPNSASSNTTFVEFVGTFGTHFMKKTFLGAKLVFEKRYTNKEVKGSSESSRSQCVANSAHASLEGSYGGVSASTSFETNTKNCDASSQDSNYFQQKGLKSETIFSIGSLPTTNLEEWSSTVKDSPLPVYFELDKISNLFTFSWFMTIPLNDPHSTDNLNGKAMYEFFENKSADYCNLVLGKPCPTEEKGCGLNSYCSPETTCVNDPDSHQGYKCSVNYGAVFIAGGWDDNSNCVAEIESFDSYLLPDLPYGVDALTLSAVGSKLYACGGIRCRGSPRSECYKLDRSSSSPIWRESTSLPKSMHYHSEAVIGSHIWFVFGNQLFDLDTSNDRFETYNLQFHVDEYHCAVSNRTHSYIIGAGSQDNEIWVNTVASSPKKWHLIARMARGRNQHGCLWLDGKVYITFGNNNRNDMEVFNTDTLQVWKSASSANYGRDHHKMMVLDGKPAVVGGETIDNKDLDNIEIYDSETDTWQMSYRKLQIGKRSIGLAQLIE